MKQRRVVVLGFMGACPIAGVLWQHRHYLESLRRLGCDVWYVEDTARYPYNPETFDIAEDSAYAEGVIAEMMTVCGLADRWAYLGRHVTPMRVAGLAEARVDALVREADAVLNVCGSHAMSERLQAARCLIYVESDPGVEQIKVARGDRETIAFLAAHHWRFTFGEGVGTGGFPVPLEGMEWLPTRQPVVTALWWAEHPPAEGAVFTTVANWSTAGQKDIEWDGETYLWSKSAEFLRYQVVPGLAGVPVEMASDIPEPEASHFVANGWRLVQPHRMSIGMEEYREYLRGSLGEFTVAKDQYVRLRTGWFSDRSACYLAAGRPVVTQETGFSDALGRPEGGVIGFSSVEEAVEGLRRVRADYAYHSRMAGEVAREWFEGTTVIRSLLERAGVW